MNTLKKLQETYIVHPHADVAINKIEACIDSTVDGGTPRSLMLVGCPGSGKTSLIETVIDTIIVDHEHPEISEETVLLLDTPSPATLKALQSEYFAVMDAHIMDIKTDTEAKRTKHIIELIKKKGYRIVVNDEIHHFTEKYKNRVESVVCDFYKTLMKQTRCTFILVGKHEAEIIVQTEGQLRRRFLGTARLLRLNKPTATDTQFSDFVTEYNENCPLKVTQFGHDFLCRTYVACDGLPGLYHALIESAIRCNKDGKKITQSDIAKAMDLEFQPSENLSFNPYSVSLPRVTAWLEQMA
ncbi:TniB family NTP-binding protein [Photobacterium kasasachensis]|uniref:TniB family NTP-binding protein n=1 Tax=Photobacterium kasasachensis TaxID=2910240 RepID=UPI003D0F1E9E